MMKLKEKLHNNRILIRQIIIYGLIGGLSALVDGVIFYFLIKSLPPIGSNIISVNIGIMLSFVLNSYFNFKVKDRLLKRALSFYTIGYIGLLISTGILFVGLHIFEIPEMTVKIVSIFIVATIQFILNKTITFKKVK